MDGIGGRGGMRIDVDGGDDGYYCGGMSSFSSLLTQRRPSSGSLSMFGGIYRKSFSSYRKLPPEPLRLSVLKLDGSCFNIEVMRTATVSDLKEAVESAFRDMQISWKHLWGQFCLSYGGHKLVVETEYISGYGIKDGDELHFIRHVSDTPYLGRKASTKLMPRTSSSEKKSEGTEIEGIGDIESGRIKHRKSVDDLGGLVGDMTPPSSHSLFSYSRLPLVEYKDEAATDCRSNCVEAFWSRLRKILISCGTSPHTQKVSWRDD